MNSLETPTERRTKAAQLAMDLQFSTDDLWQQIWSQRNLLKALKRVEKNKGAPGVDGMTTDELRPWFRDHWPEIKSLLDRGHYKPRPVRLVTIPKPGGGTRDLGVPVVVDRLIQQAILQVLNPIFSESSFGYRPGRSAQQATKVAQSYIENGYSWIVDVDLDSFFDRVQHDVLMSRVSRKVQDVRLLRLIGRYLRAGVMVEGVLQPTTPAMRHAMPNKWLEQLGLLSLKQLWCDLATQSPPQTGGTA